jgi:Protein of unknown function (DUF559)
MAALPRSATQIVVPDGYGSPLYRLDLGWPQHKVAIEYDGAQHWTDPAQRARDIERLEFLAAQGWTIIRLSWVRCAISRYRLSTASPGHSARYRT